MLNRQRGLSLIELMIAMLIGLILVAAMGTLLQRMLQSQADTAKQLRLNQELRSAMLLMTRDIRRAGYWNDAGSSGSNPYADLQLKAHCILLAYDAETSRNGDKMLGFRLQGGVLQGMAASHAGSCDGASGWEDLSDVRSTTITRLDFSQGQGTIGVVLSGALKHDSRVKQTLQQTVKLENR